MENDKYPELKTGSDIFNILFMLFTIGLWFTQAFTEWHQNGITGLFIFYFIGLIVIIPVAWFFMVNMELKIETNKEINKSNYEMNEITRTFFLDDMSIDSGSLPCPRCRNVNIKNESYPATGQISTCGNCGARGGTDDWNNGSFNLDRVNGTSTYDYIKRLSYKRPKIDKIIIVDERNK